LANNASIFRKYLPNKDKTLTSEFRKEIVNDILNKVFPLPVNPGSCLPANHPGGRSGHDPADIR
jgi:hypothetical protein